MTHRFRQPLIAFEPVRQSCRHPTVSSRRAPSGDGAVVAVETAVVPHLEEEGSVAESGAADDALGAADAERLVHRVREVRLFHETSLKRPGGASLVIRTGIQDRGAGAEIPAAEIAVAADFVDGGTVNGAANRALTVPLEFFSYLAHASYADFLRVESKYEDARTEEAIAQNYLAQELEKIDIRSNNNSLNKKFSTYVNRQSR